MKALLLSTLALLFIASCGGGGNDNPVDLTGSSGRVWPGPTDEFNQWFNVDLNCGSYRLNLTGSASDARPPNDPAYSRNTFWMSTDLNGVTISQGIWYTSKADELTGSSLTLSADTGSVQIWKNSDEGLAQTSSSVVCTAI